VDGSLSKNKIATQFTTNVSHISRITRASSLRAAVPWAETHKLEQYVSCDTVAHLAMRVFTALYRNRAYVDDQERRKKQTKSDSVDWSRSSDLWVTVEDKLLWAQRSSD
jgi:hypothetical protein